MDFDSRWAALSSRMHDLVDDGVGDSVLYAVDGVNFTAVSAFCIDETVGEGGIDALDDDFAVRKRLKIRKTIVPAVSLLHRIRHPKLGAGTFRPANSMPQTWGDYWLFDVQKVS